MSVGALPARVVNILARALGDKGIPYTRAAITPELVANLSEEDVLFSRGCGETSRRQIIEWLASHGLILDKVRPAHEKRPMTYEYFTENVPIDPTTDAALNEYAAAGWRLAGSHVVVTLVRGTALSVQGPQQEVKLFCVWEREKR